MQNDLWLIGAGSMARHYARVLNARQRSYTVVGRGEDSARAFESETGHEVIRGGLSSFLHRNVKPADAAILAVPVLQLKPLASQLIAAGIKKILLEKPGGVDSDEIGSLHKMASERQTDVWVAYNRRFYQSVMAAKKLAAEDGGVVSLSFEFTEWAHEIEALPTDMRVKERWFLANSSHVADLAFYLGGGPREIQCFTAGSLSWHSSASVFAGAGITEHNALFTYNANWASAGRWGVEILSPKRRLILRPLERLQIQKKGTVVIEMASDIDYTLDETYKAGLYAQTEAFLQEHPVGLCSLREQIQHLDVYNRIAGYK